jgi:hypothetical protein
MAPNEEFGVGRKTCANALTGEGAVSGTAAALIKPDSPASRLLQNELTATSTMQ